MRYLSLASVLLLAPILVSPIQVRAHGDPEIHEQRLLTVMVSKDPAPGGAGLSSDVFQLALPQFTVELLWRIASPEKDAIAFSVLSEGNVLLSGLKDGAKSRIPKAEKLTIGKVAGATNSFSVEIYAHTIHWDH